METEFLGWTKESVDNFIECTDMSNDEKINAMEQYIKWIASNPTCNTYPPINLLVGYYGLVGGRTCVEVKEMMSRTYPDEIANYLTQMTNSEILASVTLIAFVCNVLKSLPN